MIKRRGSRKKKTLEKNKEKVTLVEVEKKENKRIKYELNMEEEEKRGGGREGYKKEF